MTYWPISSPSVFAATKETSTHATAVSHDGADDADDATDGSVATLEERTESDRSAESEAGGRVGDQGLETQLHPQRPAQGEHVAEDDITGDIVAIKVTRSGHLFATITRSTLTIWQTKARL
jgi:hypothetical protein